MDISKWRKFKRSGTYYRNKQKYTSNFVKLIEKKDKNFKNEQQSMVFIPQSSPTISEEIQDEQEECVWNDDLTEDDNMETVAHVEIDIYNELRIWAITHKITHSALRSLLLCLNKTNLATKLPLDPRTILETPVRISNICSLGDNKGMFWYQGLKFCIQKNFHNINMSIDIQININIDGLPLFRSSKQEFWPILANIHEYPDVKVMVLGIYSGVGKPSNLSEYLMPFVNEMKDVMTNGIIINGHKISVGIRCFICDSPARSFIKGVVYFNSLFGCQKCYSIGEYNYDSRCTIFPRTECTKRTDEDFRSRKEDSHHKFCSPLEILAIDMIEQFPVADSLHLIDLGVVKRLLVGWSGGIVGFSVRWSHKQSLQISESLRSYKLPREIHRAVRGLNELSNWKGLEYRTFLLYISIVLLKDNLPKQNYEHFLQLFCAVTICSSTCYSNYLDLAHMMLHDFIENYINLYGIRYITSNVHNLIHLVDDVRNLGILSSFSAYPFESMLFQIKRLLRNGNNILVQAAKRLSEWNAIEKSQTSETAYPKLTKQNNGGLLQQALPQCKNFFYKLELKEGFILYAEEFLNQWFLTKSNVIVKMKNSVWHKKKVLIYGNSLKNMSDFFIVPIKSSRLNIYSSNLEENLPDLFELNCIKSKLVPIKYKNGEVVFLPLLHTYKSDS